MSSLSSNDFQRLASTLSTLSSFSRNLMIFNRDPVASIFKMAII